MNKSHYNKYGEYIRDSKTVIKRKRILKKILKWLMKKKREWFPYLTLESEYRESKKSCRIRVLVMSLWWISLPIFWILFFLLNYSTLFFILALLDTFLLAELCFGCGGGLGGGMG